MLITEAILKILLANKHSTVGAAAIISKGPLLGELACFKCAESMGEAYELLEPTLDAMKFEVEILYIEFE